MRPHIVCGYARTDINLPKPIAVYATLCKKLGLPLRFPGPEAAYRGVHCASDVELLNKGMLWAATTPNAANEAFNMVNGGRAGGLPTGFTPKSLKPYLGHVYYTSRHHNSCRRT